MQNTSDKIEPAKRHRGFIHLFVLLLAVGVVLSAGCEDRNDKATEEGSQRVARSAEEICPLLIGANIPDLVLRTVDGKLFNLNEAIRNKPTVLMFYRGGWCPFCNLHLSQLQGIETEIINSGYQIIGISPDRPEKLSESIVQHKMNYLLLSDSNMAAAKAFGIAFKLDESTIKKYDVGLIWLMRRGENIILCLYHPFL